jgi:class 3 adenylate cyclase
MARVRRVIVRRRRVGNPLARFTTGDTSTSGVRIIDNNTIRQFNPSMLELGDICAPCQEKEAVAAVFDLTGFTAFCNQVDSYLAIPRFLNDFLEWFFSNVRQKITEKDYGDRSALWTGLPIMVKFMGDGLILLWDARKMSEEQICRLAGSLYGICRGYRKDFYPKISMAVNKPPAVLRCGVARGKVYSIGNDREYVGHCINNASRLSRLGVSFAFPHRGFQVREHMPPEYRDIFIQKYVSIRGVGEDELVWVARDEYERLSEKSREVFRSHELAGAVPA